LTGSRHPVEPWSQSGDCKTIKTWVVKNRNKMYY